MPRAVVGRPSSCVPLRTPILVCASAFETSPPSIRMHGTSFSSHASIISYVCEVASAAARGEATGGEKRLRGAGGGARGQDTHVIKGSNQNVAHASFTNGFYPVHRQC